MKTTIQITKKTREILTSLKHHGRETYDMVLTGLIDNYKKTKK